MVSSEKEAQILRGYANRLDPTDSGAFNNLGVVFYNKRFFDDAIAAFEKALEIDSQNTLARRNLRTALKKSGKYDQFVTDKKDQLSDAPDNWELLAELAAFYKKTGDYDQAATTYEQVLKKNPANNEAHYELAEIYTRLGNYSDAIRECLISQQNYPDSAQLHLFLGQAYYNSGMDDTAIDELKKAIELEPGSAEAHFFLGFVYGDKGFYDKALEESRKAIELNPSYGKVSSNLAIAHANTDEVVATDDQVSTETTTFNRHYTLGVAYFNRGLLKEARNEFSQALEADSDARLIYKNIGEIDLLLNNRKEALTNYLKASIVEPYSSKISNDIGVIYHLDDNFVEAFQHYQKALEVDRHYAPARNNLAVLLFQLGLEEEALSLFSLILYQKDVNQYECYLNYGVALAKLANANKAVECLEKAKALHDTSLTVNRTLGIVYHDDNQNFEALDAFQAALALNPDDAQSYYYKAIVLNSLKRYQEAIEATRKGSELGPFNAEYHFVLATDSFAKREENMTVASKVILENQEDLSQIKKWMGTDALSNIWVSGKEDERPDLIIPSPQQQAEPHDLDAVADAKPGEAPSEALKQLEAAFEENPEDVKAIFELGMAYMKLERHEDAIRVLKKAPADDAAAQRNLGILLVKKRNYIDALQAFYNAANSENDDYRVHAAIGILHEEVGLRENAIRAYRKAISLKEDCVLALRKMGSILLHMGDLEEAKKSFKALLKAVPNDMEAYNSLAEIFFKTGRYDQAIRVYNLLQKKGQQPMDFQYQLALCNYGRIFQRAIKGWEKVVSNSKNEKERKQALRKLKYARDQEQKLRLTWK